MNVPQTTTEYTEKLRQALQQDTTLRQLAAQATTRYAASTAGPSAWSSGLAKRRSITPARPRHRAWCWWTQSDRRRQAGRGRRRGRAGGDYLQPQRRTPQLNTTGAVRPLSPLRLGVGVVPVASALLPAAAEVCGRVACFLALVPAHTLLPQEVYA